MDILVHSIFNFCNVFWKCCPIQWCNYPNSSNIRLKEMFNPLRLCRSFNWLALSHSIVNLATLHCSTNWKAGKKDSYSEMLQWNFSKFCEILRKRTKKLQLILHSINTLPIDLFSRVKRDQILCKHFLKFNLRYKYLHIKEFDLFGNIYWFNILIPDT